MVSKKLNLTYFFYVVFYILLIFSIVFSVGNFTFDKNAIYIYNTSNLYKNDDDRLLFELNYEKMDREWQNIADNFNNKYYRYSTLYKVNQEGFYYSLNNKKERVTVCDISQYKNLTKFSSGGITLSTPQGFSDIDDNSIYISFEFAYKMLYAQDKYDEDYNILLGQHLKLFTPNGEENFIIKGIYNHQSSISNGILNKFNYDLFGETFYISQ